MLAQQAVNKSELLFCLGPTIRLSWHGERGAQHSRWRRSIRFNILPEWQRLGAGSRCLTDGGVADWVGLRNHDKQRYIYAILNQQHGQEGGEDGLLLLWFRSGNLTLLKWTELCCQSGWTAEWYFNHDSNNKYALSLGFKYSLFFSLLSCQFGLGFSKTHKANHWIF